MGKKLFGKKNKQNKAADGRNQLSKCSFLSRFDLIVQMFTEVARYEDFFKEENKE